MVIDMIYIRPYDFINMVHHGYVCYYNKDKNKSSIKIKIGYVDNDTISEAYKFAIDSLYGRNNAEFEVTYTNYLFYTNLPTDIYWCDNMKVIYDKRQTEMFDKGNTDYNNHKFILCVNDKMQNFFISKKDDRTLMEIVKQEHIIKMYTFEEPDDDYDEGDDDE